MTDSTLPFDEAIATAATGDLWLFRGRSLADRAIQTMTNSPVNHVGMCVALDDMPPLLWHAELGKSLPDAWTGERHRGVQLHKLADAVTTWDDKYGQRAWVRRMEGAPVTREMEDRLIETIDKYDGKPFPTTPGLVRSWATGGVRRREASRETIYCAELVAVTMQHMGLLPDKRPMSWYDPGKFWSGDEIQLIEPYRLGGEIVVMLGDRRRRHRRGADGLHARAPAATAVAGAELVAVADPDPAAAAGASASASDVYAEALKLIATAVDAVIIASPAYTHEAYTLACIAAGKPVLCEKPLATSAEAAAHRPGRTPGALTVGFMRRYDPGYRALKAQLDAGAIGAPLLVHCAHRNPFVHDFFDSAMIITDSAVHEVDIARWLLGEEIVRATVHTPRPSGRARPGLQDPQLLRLRDGVRPGRRRRGLRERRLRLRHPLRGRGGGGHARAPAARDRRAAFRSASRRAYQHELARAGSRARIRAQRLGWLRRDGGLRGCGQSTENRSTGELRYVSTLT